VNANRNITANYRSYKRNEFDVNDHELDVTSEKFDVIDQQCDVTSEAHYGTGETWS